MHNKKLICQYLMVPCITFIISGCSANNNISSSSQYLSDFQGNVALAASGIPLSLEPVLEVPSIYPVQLTEPVVIEDTILSTYTTEFKGSSGGRANNIKVGSKYIDKKIIQPGETFSFNDTVGPTNKWRGFEMARIFINGKDAEGYGGGICQVSSTLYNAALDSGMNIIERHPHSKKVYYVPEDRDAATSYGAIDLKFTNNRPFPIKINSQVDGDKLSVSLEAV